MAAHFHPRGFSEENPFPDDCDSCDMLAHMDSYQRLQRSQLPKVVHGEPSSPVSPADSATSQALREKEPPPSHASVEHAQVGEETVDDPSEASWPMRHPPGLRELGSSTWTFLHTMAAYYPKAPTKDRQEETANFIHSFARLFPCQVCAEDFQGIIAEQWILVMSSLSGCVKHTTR
eukprot:CAMPEP_0177671732 /NCGR_PEP_ID=MMETSP0447-20121125/24899_1 /TAXON_ID=0 /ORGANISM="Stygamoeba regulata, Strain BSH-02190019" /LENGTH=175 /DNA_ID=CAMNT_0019179221 /DNA_START=3 /DNA_END=530 /DNA_ORIENTATION=+